MKQKLWHHIMTGLGLLMLLAATIFVLLHWQSLPEQIPTHFDGAGQASAYGGKGSLIMLLFLSWGMYALITVTSFFPSTWNMPGKNRPAGLRAAADMLALLRVQMAFMFAWLLFCSAAGRDLGVWFLPVTLGTITLNVLIGIVRALRS